MFFDSRAPFCFIEKPYIMIQVYKYSINCIVILFRIIRNIDIFMNIIEGEFEFSYTTFYVLLVNIKYISKFFVWVMRSIRNK